jgi:hypothetical protein
MCYTATAVAGRTLAERAVAGESVPQSMSAAAAVGMGSVAAGPESERCARISTQEVRLVRRGRPPCRPAGWTQMASGQNGAC